MPIKHFFSLLSHPKGTPLKRDFFGDGKEVLGKNSREKIQGVANKYFVHAPFSMLHFPFLIGIIIIFTSCQENMPIIPALGPQDVGDRKVLIEEFTGVRCVNCPQGSAEIENLKGLYGDNLIAVSIHAGFFAPPYSESKFDFRTEDGDELLSFLGEPLGYPSAIVNRKQFDGQFNLQTNQTTWAGFIEVEANLAPVVNISLSRTYNEDSRVVSIEITIIANQNIKDDLYLSLMLTENNIMDAQLTPDGLETDYIHQHVLRDVVSNFGGDALGDITLGTPFTKSYTYTLAENWKVEDCRIVAFVHLSGENKEVLQVEEIKI